jgi:hypothetical protein
MSNGTIISSKMDKCPSCFRTLCKRTEQEEGAFIEYKHRGCSLMTKAAIIKCLGCGKHYVVNGTDGIIEETSV